MANLATPMVKPATARAARPGSGRRACVLGRGRGAGGGARAGGYPPVAWSCRCRGTRRSTRGGGDSGVLEPRASLDRAGRYLGPALYGPDTEGGLWLRLSEPAQATSCGLTTTLGKARSRVCQRGMWLGASTVRGQCEQGALGYHSAGRTTYGVSSGRDVRGLSWEKEDDEYRSSDSCDRLSGRRRKGLTGFSTFCIIDGTSKRQGEAVCPDGRVQLRWHGCHVVHCTHP
jgi:hypothetical protein